MANLLELIPPQTRVTENGHGAAVDIRSSGTRTFLCTLEIFDQIEQESLDVAIWASADGQDFGHKPILESRNASIEAILGRSSISVFCRTPISCAPVGSLCAGAGWRRIPCL